METLIEVLKWDSDFFGFPIGRVTRQRLTSVDRDHILAAAERLGLRCLYYLANSTDTESRSAALTGGFDPIQDRIELRKTLDARQEMIPAVLADAADSVRLEEIAAHAFVDSRFYRDSRFPRPKVEALYRIWALKSLESSDHVTYVVRRAGEVGGFLVAKIAGAAAARIELFAVATVRRQQGIGTELLGMCAADFWRRKFDAATVVTFGSAAAALALYQQQGFTIEETGLWFHRWFE